MSTVVLVSCSAGKEEKSMPAEKLYNSDLFKKQLEYAKKLSNDSNIYIISAKYQYQCAFVADQEINLLAALTEIMCECEFK